MAGSCSDLSAYVAQAQQKASGCYLLMIHSLFRKDHERTEQY